MNNVNKQYEYPQSVKKSIGFIGWSFIVISLLVVGLYAVTQAYGPTGFSTLETMEHTYQMTGEQVHQMVDIYALQEVTLAKYKLELFYGDSLELTTEQVQSLVAKAEGRNLAAHSLFRK